MIARILRCIASGLLLAAWIAPGLAQSLDYALAPRRIADDVYVLVGRTEDFSRANGGNIVNTAFVVAPEGVVVIDSGPSRLYGEHLRRAIAQVTPKPILRVFNTHHHPDHYLGNQAFADVATAALPETISGQRLEGGAFAENLYRMAGDWLKGTESSPAREPVKPGRVAIGGREFELLVFSGHTHGDLAILDAASGVLFVGDLVFWNRAPTTPHANIGDWLGALDRLEAIRFEQMLPGHGEPLRDRAGIVQTRSYLRWLDSVLRSAAENGDEMMEVIARPLPPEFAEIPLVRSEFTRSVAHLYRRYEASTLKPSR